MSETKKTFIEVGYYQVCKHKQHAEGDVFLSQKNPSDGRVITALSDGLGSGIKAGVLADRRPERRGPPWNGWGDSF